MRDLLIKFYLPRLHESKSDGRRILQLIYQFVPELAPEFYNNCEPINKQFNDIESALDDWGSSFLWKRRKPSTFGMVTFGSAHPRRPFHTSLLLEAGLEVVETKRLAHFAQEFARTFRPDISLMHIFPKARHGNRQPVLNISTFVLNESLPNLYWATILGAPYVSLFGRKRILSTPAAVVEEIADDLIYVQLTHDLMDNRNSPDSVEIVRMAAKKHLDSDAFFDAQLGASYSYRTPEFHIEP